MKKPKQLLLINTLSVVFLIMFCSSNLFSQTESSGGLSMPFYGTVGEVIYAGKPACNNCRVSLIVDEQATLFLHCQNWTCAPYPLFCTCGAANVSKTVEDVPQGTLVETKFIKCMEVGGKYQWVELDYRFRSVPPLDADESYEIDFDMNDEWHNVGKINFTETTPPDCYYAENCASGFIEEMPDTVSKIKPFSFTKFKMCKTRVNSQGELVIPLGQFSIVQDGDKSSNIFNWTPEDDINVCFYLQMQEFKFNFNVENIELYYMKELCTDNIQNPPVNATIVPDIDALNQIPATECSKLLESLKAHETYPFMDGFYNGYFFEEIAMVHETEHQRDWEQLYVGNYISEYFNIPDKVNYSCEDFNSILEAKEKILRDVKNMYASDYWNPHRKDWLTKEYNYPVDEPTELLKRKKEEEVHKRKSVQEKIKEYKKAIKDKCNSN